MNIIVQAWRNIWRNRQRTWTVALAAIVGILGINMGIGFMNGMFSLMIDGAIQSGLGHVQVRPTDYLESRSEDLLPVRYLSAKPLSRQVLIRQPDSKSLPFCEPA